MCVIGTTIVFNYSDLCGILDFVIVCELCSLYNI